MISRASVNLTMCTGGAYRPFRHDRHLRAASNFHSGVSRGRLIASLTRLWRRRLIKSPWTEEDNERLKRLAAEGASAFRAAAALKRKVSVVRKHARQIGLTLPSIRETRKKLTGSGNHTHRAGLV